MGLLGMLCIICAALCEFEFIYLPAHKGGVKSSKQIAPMFKTMKIKYKLKTDLNAVEYNWNYDICMFIEKKKQLAFLQADVGKGLISGSEIPMISFYCITVIEEYQGRGLSYEILETSVKKLREEHKLPESAILALHVSPLLNNMHVTLKLYYSMGFCKGLYVKTGPHDYKFHLEKAFEKATDVYELVDDSERGPYIMMYCRLKDFKRGNKVPADWAETGMKLQAICEALSPKEDE